MSSTRLGATSAESVSDDAQAAVIHALVRARSAADDAVPLLIAQRVDDTNRLSAALVTTLAALRQAAPTTREVDPAALLTAIDALAIADRYFDVAERAAFRKIDVQRDYLIAAARVLDAADVTLRSCDESRCMDADVAYAAAFERYDAFREQAQRLADAGARDPWATWVLAGSPDTDYAGQLEYATTGPFATRGREIRAVARALETLPAADCVAALEHLPAQGNLPDPCLDSTGAQETASVVSANAVDQRAHAR